jgi:hypothetical protein
VNKWTTYDSFHTHGKTPESNDMLNDIASGFFYNQTNLFENQWVLELLNLQTYSRQGWSSLIQHIGVRSGIIVLSNNMPIIKHAPFKKKT